jgi:hypothetical protein
MDGLTFTTEIIKALAWPATAIFLTFLLRKPIVELIPFMKKLKYKELELEFSQEVMALKSEVGALPEEPTTSLKEGTSISKALDLVSYSTRAAIIEAWIELEASAIEVASSFWSQSSSDVFRNDPKLGEYLHQCKVLDDKQLKIYRELRRLRNKAAHVEEMSLSEQDARSYVEMAGRLARQIKQ